MMLPQLRISMAKISPPWPGSKNASEKNMDRAFAIVVQSIDSDDDMLNFFCSSKIGKLPNSNRIVKLLCLKAVNSNE